METKHLLFSEFCAGVCLTVSAAFFTCTVFDLPESASGVTADRKKVRKEEWWREHLQKKKNRKRESVKVE